MKMKKIALAATAVMVLHGAANASLLSLDSVYGTDTVTRDTATGLDWLDWSVTEGITWDDMETLRAPGGLYEGWRYATVDELATLYSVSAGVSSYDLTAAGVAANQELQQLLGGPLSIFNTHGDSFHDQSSRAFLGTNNNNPTSDWHDITEIVLRSANGTWNFQVATPNAGGASDTVAFSGYGHALVAIPEPASLGLIGLVSGGIFFTRRFFRV
jgi:hypothetical protein